MTLIDTMQQRLDALYVHGRHYRVIEIRLHPLDYCTYTEFVKNQRTLIGMPRYSSYLVAYPEFAGIPVSVCATARQGTPQLVI